MGFLKRYPIFCALILVLALVLAGGIYLVMQQQSRLEEEKDSFEADLRRLEQLSRGVPYGGEDGTLVQPVEGNREKLEGRLEEVRGDLGRIREILFARTEKILADPADEFTFLPKLQSFIAEMKSEAAAGGVALNSDEAFGFARYAIRAEQPDASEIPVLDRQRQVLEYILRQLLESDPSALLSVERELVEGSVDEEELRRDDAEDDVFVIEDLVTLRANEFIESFAFRLVFTGRTAVLREFLNRLAEFELPLVVRSIEVVPVEEGDEPEPEAEEETGGGEDALFALFGGGGQEADAPEEETEEAEEGTEPVITENKSKFTVVIEFVEVRIEDAEEKIEEGEVGP
jgi:hypothetical protein